MSDEQAAGAAPADARAKLIADLHADDWETGAPGEFARRAAACARGRARRRRVASATGALALAAAILAGGVWLNDAGRERRSEMRLAHREPSRQSASAPRFPVALIPGRGQAFELSDDEALELLRGRPLMIMPEADGGRRIILLDTLAGRGAVGANGSSPAL